ncbi:hypothetical protein M316_0128 [Nitrincola phage 1M3-16]|uniref:hypothetical protein n=1 Tax=Nitrincola phage 1M3-16 TaxID=1472912 RepID=UPI000444B211|nr:hypothetical protein GJ22_gp024 [Nitrincola phage 1M3-16]AHX01193.1 hypothetical protein M316_0128 [Nitrincola phage 1M3-16]
MSGVGREYKFPQTLTYWRKSGEPDMYGRDTYIVGKIKCRWEETSRQYINEFGEHSRSNAYIYTIGDDLMEGDVVIQGDYTSLKHLLLNLILSGVDV